MVGRGFSRWLRRVTGVSGPSDGDRFMGTDGGVGAKREREAREVKRPKVISLCAELLIWLFAFVVY